MASFPTTDEIRLKIKDYLEGANLDQITPKYVRSKLENFFGKDLSDRRKEINKIITEVINEEESSSSSDSDNVVDREVKGKKSGKNHSRSDDSSDDDPMDDEEVARKLQDELRRPTRSGNKPIKSTKTKTKKTESKKRKGGKTSGGYMATLRLSPALAEFTGCSEMQRHQVVKKVWDYCKERNLMDPKNKQFAICDEALFNVIGKKRFRLFGMMKHLARHFEKDN